LTASSSPRADFPGFRRRDFLYTRTIRAAPDGRRGDRGEGGLFAFGLHTMRRVMKSIASAVAVALALSAPARAEAVNDPYTAAYAASMKDRLPVVVFVGLPAREVSGTRSVSVEKFPDAAAPSVVVGVVRETEMVRKDLSGSATTTDIQSAIASLAPP